MTKLSSKFALLLTLTAMEFKNSPEQRGASADGKNFSEKCAIRQTDKSALDKQMWKRLLSGPQKTREHIVFDTYVSVHILLWRGICISKLRIRPVVFEARQQR